MDPDPITSMAPVSGSPSVGSTLTSGTLTPANSTATYRWLISDTLDGIYTPIAGATSPSYTIVPDDIGKYLKVEATGTGAYSGVRTSSAVGPVNQRTAHGDWRHRWRDPSGCSGNSRSRHPGRRHGNL
jgi:hypothetical protein